MTKPMPASAPAWFRRSRIRSATLQSTWRKRTAESICAFMALPQIRKSPTGGIKNSCRSAVRQARNCDSSVHTTQFGSAHIACGQRYAWSWPLLLEYCRILSTARHQPTARSRLRLLPCRHPAPQATGAAGPWGRTSAQNRTPSREPRSHSLRKRTSARRGTLLRQREPPGAAQQAQRWKSQCIRAVRGRTSVPGHHINQLFVEIPAAGFRCRRRKSLLSPYFV